MEAETENGRIAEAYGRMVDAGIQLPGSDEEGAAADYAQRFIEE